MFFFTSASEFKREKGRGVSGGAAGAPPCPWVACERWVGLKRAEPSGRKKLHTLNDS
jgi:hypothetical protein